MERLERIPRLNREQKFMGALSDLQREGKTEVCRVEVLDRVKVLYPSGIFNVPFYPLWDKPIENLKTANQIEESNEGFITIKRKKAA